MARVGHVIDPITRFWLTIWKWRLIRAQSWIGSRLLLAGLGPRQPFGLVTLDRWYRWGFHEAGAQVYFNGRPKRSVIAFDDKRGWIVAHTARPPRRHPLYPRFGAEVELLVGRVDVFFEPPSAIGGYAHG